MSFQQGEDRDDLAFVSYGAIRRLIPRAGELHRRAKAAE
jgi:hypothetical protein